MFTCNWLFPPSQTALGVAVTLVMAGGSFTNTATVLTREVQPPAVAVNV